MAYTIQTPNQVAEVREIKASLKTLTGRAFTVKSGSGFSTRDHIVIQSTPARMNGMISSIEDMEIIKEIFSLDSRPTGSFRIMPNQRAEALRRIRTKLS